MDLPLFHLDYLNNRMLIGIIAILHVLINHTMAVGGIPVVTYLSWKGYKTKDPHWENFAYKLMFVFFITTTTLGAMTGVGIWLSSSLVNPMAIGSLLRVFFWAWFTEWLVFVTEVVLILFYFMTWKKYQGENKKTHIKIGVILSIFSWITMAIIVAILGFMMDTGSWRTDKTLISGFFNPIYLPQLAFRTFMAIIMGLSFALAMVPFFASKQNNFHLALSKTIGKAILFFIPIVVFFSFWYYSVIPKSMLGNMAVAITTQAFTDWYQHLKTVILGSAAAVFVCGLILVFKTKWSIFIYPIPIVLLFTKISMAERVREFIRKPYAIADYLYSNGYFKSHMPIYQRDGVLKHATFGTIKNITNENEWEAGKEVFLMTCSRCHTVNGINSIRKVTGTMLGWDKKWDPEILSAYFKNMHNARPYMPPFPGNEQERDALAKYVSSLQSESDVLYGSQTQGINPQK